MSNCFLSCFASSLHPLNGAFHGANVYNFSEIQLTRFFFSFMDCALGALTKLTILACMHACTHCTHANIRSHTNTHLLDAFHPLFYYLLRSYRSFNSASR